jgi:hypothetical protein
MLGQGKQASMIFLKEKADVAKKIVDDINAKSKTTSAPVEVGIETKE